MNSACIKTEVEDDEFYTWDAPNTLVCTRRFDRLTNYFTSADTTFITSLYTHKDTCIEEVVDREECCYAKFYGKNGIGLEFACDGTEAPLPSEECNPLEGFCSTPPLDYDIDWWQMTEHIENNIDPWMEWAMSEGPCTRLREDLIDEPQILLPAGYFFFH